MLYCLTYLKNESYLKYNDRSIIKVGHTDGWEDRYTHHSGGWSRPSFIENWDRNLIDIKLFSLIDGTKDQENLIHQCLKKHVAFGREWYYDTSLFRKEVEFLFRQKFIWDNEVYCPNWNRNKGKPKNDFTVSILHWVNTNIEPGESMKTQEIFDLMRITEDKTPHFKKLFTNQNLSSSSFGSTLKEYGFTWFSKKGRNGYTVLSRK